MDWALTEPTSLGTAPVLCGRSLGQEHHREAVPSPLVLPDQIQTAENSGRVAEAARLRPELSYEWTFPPPALCLPTPSHCTLHPWEVKQRPATVTTQDVCGAKRDGKNAAVSAKMLFTEETSFFSPQRQQMATVFMIQQVRLAAFQQKNTLRKLCDIHSAMV